MPCFNIPELQGTLTACYKHLIDICCRVKDGCRSEIAIKENGRLQLCVLLRTANQMNRMTYRCS